MEQLFAKHLFKDIPAISQQDRSKLVRLMLGQSMQCSVDELTNSLVKSGVDLGPILSAILRCQWLSIQQLMKEIDPDNINKKLHAFSQCVTRFSELQTSLVTAFDRNWHMALNEEIFERVIVQNKAQWASEKTVRLHNYFHKMPVTATAKYIDSRGVYLHIKMSAEVGRVFMATQEMRNAWVSCSDKKYVLQAGVVHCRDSELTLIVRSVEEATAELRSDVRIQPEEAVSIKVNRHGVPFVALLRDLSFTGMGLTIAQEIELVRGEQLACAFQMAETKYFLEARVCWAFIRDGKTHTGLKLDSLGPFSEPLRKFIFGQQQIIIRRLKQLNDPAWMK